MTIRPLVSNTLKTTKVGFEVKPQEAVAACFEAKPIETITTGFEVKPSEIVLVVLRSNH
jgi:hypothetical protein